MKEKENNRFGIYILLINIIISLFLLSSEGDKLPFIITTLVSNIIAIIFNIVVIIKSNKRIVNYVTGVGNILVLLIILFLWLKKII